MPDVLTLRSLRYVLSFAVSSEKIVSELSDFCTVLSHVENDIFPSIDVDWRSYSNVADSPNFTLLRDMLIATNESVKESVDWSSVMVTPVFVSNLEELTKKSQLNEQITAIINKLKQYKNLLVVLFFVGMLAAIVEIALIKSVGTYLMGNIIWMLCCVSLYVTIKLIIRDWKKEIYASGKEER